MITESSFTSTVMSHRHSVLDYNKSKLSLIVEHTKIRYEGLTAGHTYTKSFLDLNDIKYVKLIEYKSDKVFEIKLGFNTSYKYYLTWNKGLLVSVDYSKSEPTYGSEIQFPFEDKSKAEKLYKALLHMKKLVGVSNDLF
jgi:hypothetical protein